MLRVRHFRSFSELPKPYLPFIAHAAEQSFFQDRAWFEYLMTYLYPEHNEMRLYAVEDGDDGRPLLVVPMRYTLADAAVHGAHTLTSINHMENFSFVSLLFDPLVKDRVQVLSTLFTHLKKGGQEERPACFDVLRLCPVEEGSELANTLRRALRKSGLWVQAYKNSFNSYENTAGLSYEGYFANRSANLRYNVRRRQRNLLKNGTLEFNLYCDNGELERGIVEYMAVSNRSWQPASTTISPAILNLIHLAADKGCLRLGILRVDGKAAATQFWIVTGGVASCVRLGYDPAYKKQAVGVVLTNYMISHVLEQDHVQELDFGYGEDEYKGSWMKEYRYYAGYMAFNPAKPRGFYYGLKHILGQPLKRSIKQLYYLLSWLKQLTLKSTGTT